MSTVPEWVPFAGVLVVLIYSFNKSTAQLVQEGHSNLTQEATVKCQLIGTESLLQFSLVKNQDRVQLIYTVNSTDSTDTSIGVFSNQAGNITGDGSSNNPYTFSITANVTADGFTFTGNDLVEKKAYTIGNETIGVNVMVKAVYEAPFYEKAQYSDDVLYRASCNFSNVSDVVITTGIVAKGNISESPSIRQDAAVLQVIDDTTGTPTNSVIQGNPIKLRLEIIDPAFAIGVYAHSCYVCDTEYCNGTLSIEFILASGCANGGFISKFVSNGTGVSETNPFISFLLGNLGSIFFQCSVNYCYQKNQPDCSDFCSTNVGRRKRQVYDEAVSNDELLTTFLAVQRSEGLNGVVAANTLDAQAIKDLEAQNVTLVAAVSAVALLIAVSLTVGTVCYWSKYRRKSPQ